jgi:hypothetical protein
LTPKELTIHDRFYSVTVTPEKVNLDGIRVVDLTVERGWRPAVRTNGFANSHYRSGWFRLANGTKVEMYNAGGRRMVLIPATGDGVTLLLDTANPDQFVEELRRNWRH